MMEEPEIPKKMTHVVQTPEAATAKPEEEEAEEEEEEEVEEVPPSRHKGKHADHPRRKT